jgi:type II secretory pathway component GspD/PulD (secretin)
VTERTVYLNNVSQQAEANEIVTALRNALSPCDKIYLIPSQGAIVMEAPPDQLALAQKLINELDRPKKNYRLTYTVTDMDGSKQIGTQHFAMIMTSGQATSLKLGNRVPVATEPTGTQYTYIDVGMNFDATLTEMGNNVMLRSSVDQSGAAPEKSDVAGTQQPIIRQASLKGESLLAPGKPLVLGSMDIPGSTSRLQIEVVMEPLP